MDKQRWKELIISAVCSANNGDESSLLLLSEMCEEGDQVKQLLREKGFGCTGMGILETAKQVN